MNEMLSSGIELMLIGMSIVFAFLAMLVFAIEAMSSLVQRYFPEIPGPHKSTATHTSDTGTIAAIAAAVHQYRNKHHK